MVVRHPCEGSMWKHSTEPDPWMLLFSHSVVSDFVTPWTVACLTALSMGFPRQEYCSALPIPSPGDLPHPGIKLASPALAGGFFTLSHRGRHEMHKILTLKRSPVAFHYRSLCAVFSTYMYTENFQKWKYRPSGNVVWFKSLGMNLF